jgi:hypothetical protein
MKKQIIILGIIALIAGGCFGQATNKNITKNNNTLKNNFKLINVPVTAGLGILDISFNNPVPLYRTENDEAPFDTLVFKEDKDGVWQYETNRLKSLNPLQKHGGPSHKMAMEALKMGAGFSPAVLAFRVVEANDDYFRVVVDESSFETVVIRKRADYAVVPQREGMGGVTLPEDKPYSGYYTYETWEHLLLRAQYVSFDRENYAVYDAPEGKKIFENTDRKFLPYKVSQVQGDWIKVEKAAGGYDGYFEGIKNAEGWVKWKNETEILVGITEYTVE